MTQNGTAVPLFRFAFYVYRHSGRTGGVPVTIGIAPPPMLMAGRSHCLRRFYHARTVTECIIEFLLYEYHVQKSTTIKLNMTKKELAEKIGVQRPSLSRELNKMRKDGLIIYDPKQITITDVDLLNKLHIDS